MKTITNPTNEQITEALILVETSKQNAVVTGDRYAMTKLGTFINHGNISTPKSHIKAIRYISVYGEEQASIAYVLENISMYPKQAVLDAGYTPVSAGDIPYHFDQMETIIYEH